MRVVDFVIDNILLDGKLYTNLYENILIYNISYKTFTCEEPLRIRFDVADELIKIFDGTRYLVLFGPVMQFMIGLSEKSGDWN